MCTFQTEFHEDILEMKTTEERWKGQAEEEKEELQMPRPLHHHHSPQEPHFQAASSYLL